MALRSRLVSRLRCGGLGRRAVPCTLERSSRSRASALRCSRSREAARSRTRASGAPSTSSARAWPVVARSRRLRAAPSAHRGDRGAQRQARATDREPPHGRARERCSDNGALCLFRDRNTERTDDRDSRIAASERARFCSMVWRRRRKGGTAPTRSVKWAHENRRLSG
jgi:hypothetical protein